MHGCAYMRACGTSAIRQNRMRRAWSLELAPGVAQVYGRWMPGTSGVHGRSIRGISSTIRSVAVVPAGG